MDPPKSASPNRWSSRLFFGITLDYGLQSGIGFQLLGANSIFVPFRARMRRTIHLRRSLTRLRTRLRSRPVLLFALVRDEWYWWVETLRNSKISYVNTKEQTADVFTNF